MTKLFREFEVCTKFKHKDRIKILAYVEALYTRKSPLNKIQDLRERKLAACEKAGLNPNDEFVNQIMEMQNEQVNEIIFQYLGIYQNSNRYHKLCADQELYWNMQKLLFKPLDDLTDETEAEQKMKRRCNISEMADKLLRQIELSYSEVYGTQDVIEMAEMNVKKLLTPELRLMKKGA